jgi:glycosyltransferase involved in cell wall biosynthesis
MVPIIYAHDGANEYDRFFLDFLTKKYAVYLLTFYRKSRFVSPKTVVIRMPKICYAPTSKAEGLFMYLFFPLRVVLLKLFCIRLKPSAVLGCMATKYGFYAAVARAKPLILIVWGSDVLIAPKRFFFMRFMAGFALRKADAVIVDSEVQQKAALQLGCSEEKILRFPWFDLKNVRVSHSRENVRRELGWSNNPIIISLRKHDPVYCVECLIDAIPNIISEVPESRFLILEEGQLTERLKRRVKELGIEQFVKFVGKVPQRNVASYLNASDVYVSTSLSDGTSANLLEAMTLKVPAVVTNIHGNREWIENDWNGLLVPIKDPVSLAKKVVLLIKNEELRHQIKENELKTIQTKVDWSKSSKAFTNLIFTLSHQKKQDLVNGREEG